ncbi:TetR family transcriptional regulator [Nocardia sp. SYP-A9097]|uniref:TetR/AcrR family transcriptional regulator n=1 Tax=Nocardia sp. SYP-A9097 TaxID=2663237 RepID=UPI00129AC4EF|nr:TetR/AcrR family transcriptional regulator [Nocardia sp. SYP-A9097]MRH92408.1 TetR family transcriptional regulator [Nocardia sp. SYP-A9097]
MARIAEERRPASPVSPRQLAAWNRMLTAAADLGATTDLDRVQMTDVARSADVAIGTLYRYFPSKTHLFGALFEERVLRFVDERWLCAGVDPIADIGTNMVEMNRSLLKTPNLCAAMVRSITAGYMKDVPNERPWLGSQVALHKAISATLGLPADERDGVHDSIQLLIYSWWGILVSSLSQRVSQDISERQLRVAASSLLPGRTY